eukprot:sb/3465806/
MVLPFASVCGCLAKDDDPDKEHLHKPREGKLYQQKMKPCCMLVITTQKVVTLFVVTGLLFIPIGVALLVQSTKIYEYDYDYTNCKIKGNPSTTCPDKLEGLAKGSSCECASQILTVPDSVSDSNEIMFLYGLTNYYQNHRMYRRSQSFAQLLGDETADCLDQYCEPYRNDEDGKAYYPRGAIANSYFLDTFKINKKGGDWKEIYLNTTNISWETDRQYKFIVPEGFQSNSTAFSWPRDWKVWQDKVPFLPTQVNDEHLINWMNPAAFPSFTKLYARVRLDPGEYMLNITYRYQVKDFRGSKFIRLAETSWMGGRSLFLGSAYTFVGIACLLAALFFIVISRKTRTKRHARRKKIDEQLENFKATTGQTTEA